MVHTVGLYGARGNVGKPTLKYLAKAAEEGQIKLVVFHREGSKPDTVTYGENISSKVLDASAPIEQITAAVKGVNVFASTTGTDAIATEPRLAEGLAKSPDMQVYIPPLFSTTWNATDSENPKLGGIISYIHAADDAAKAHGLATAIIYTGGFDSYVFAQDFMNMPVKKNLVVASEQQAKHGFPITTMDHLGASIAALATRDPQSTKNKEFSAVSFMPTGEQLAAMYTKLNGTKATIRPISTEEVDALSQDPFGPAALGYRKKWEDNSWEYESNGRTPVVKYSGPTIEEFAKQYL